jgi:ferredoxin
MALLITDECISCGACLPECPNEAIFETRSDAEGKGNHVGDGQELVITFMSLHTTAAPSASVTLTNRNARPSAQSTIAAFPTQHTRKQRMSYSIKRGSSIPIRILILQRYGAECGTSSILVQRQRPCSFFREQGLCVLQVSPLN